MNWIRDNIVKILVVLGVCILIIVIILIWASFAGGGKGPTISNLNSYKDYETALKNAGVKYVTKNKSMFEKSTTNQKISIEKLVEKKYINELYAIEDKNVRCSGYVEVINLNEDNKYRFVPIIKCGSYYETQTFATYLTKEENIVTSGQGLYKMNDKYIFRGDNPNNYIKLGNYLYRIINITNEGYVKVVATDKTSSTYAFDDRYNSEIKRKYGINDYSVSRVKDSLNFIFNNTDPDKEKVYVTEDMKDYIMEYDYCIGKRKSDDTAINSASECSETIKQKIGLINLSDYYNASIDTGCKSIYNLECGNYNYFYNYERNTFLTMNTSASDTYSTYVIFEGELINKKSKDSTRLYPVFYLDNVIYYSSGEGTLENPYVIN